jgi:hypothetical protein
VLKHDRPRWCEQVGGIRYAAYVHDVLQHLYAVDTFEVMDEVAARRIRHAEEAVARESIRTSINNARNNIAQAAASLCRQTTVGPAESASVGAPSALSAASRIYEAIHIWQQRAWGRQSPRSQTVVNLATKLATLPIVTAVPIIAGGITGALGIALWATAGLVAASASVAQFAKQRLEIDSKESADHLKAQLLSEFGPVQRHARELSEALSRAAETVTNTSVESAGQLGNNLRVATADLPSGMPDELKGSGPQPLNPFVRALQRAQWVEVNVVATVGALIGVHLATRFGLTQLIEGAFVAASTAFATANAAGFVVAQAARKGQGPTIKEVARRQWSDDERTAREALNCATELVEGAIREYGRPLGLVDGLSSPLPALPGDAKKEPHGPTGPFG